MATSPARLRPEPTRTPTASRPRSEVRSGGRLQALTAHPELLVLLGLAAVLDLWSLSANGLANTYYSAAVKGMATDWHLFLFGSFDPAGVQTVDKPPLALWIQALSARAFGFSSWSILVPQALMGITSVWVAPPGRVRALGQLAAGGGAMAVVGLAWPVLVWLTPAADRPWVSGTTDDSVWSLILGYNGLGRLAGQTGGPGGGGPGGGGGGVFGGDAGILRLLNSSLGGQSGWLLGFAIVAGIGVVVATRLRRDDARTGWVIATGGIFATTAIALSFASGIFHPYYVSALAPFATALVGGGVGLALRGGRLGRILAPLAITGGMVTELVVLRESATGLGWLVWVVVVVGALSAAALAAFDDPILRRGALGAGVALLLVGPAIWSFQTLGHATQGTFPAGGPATSAFGGGGGPGGGAGFGGANGGGPPRAPGTGTRSSGAATRGAAGGGGMFGGQDLSAALAYVKANGGGTLAVESQQGASSAILQQDASVAGIGGFSGRESTVSTAWLADAVARGEIRWVSGSSGGGMGARADGRRGSTTAISAATSECKAVSSVSGLYDCAGQASALRAAASS